MALSGFICIPTVQRCSWSSFRSYDGFARVAMSMGTNQLILGLYLGKRLEVYGHSWRKTLKLWQFSECQKQQARHSISRRMSIWCLLKFQTSCRGRESLFHQSSSFLFLQWKAFVPTHWRINGSSSWTCLWLSMLICNYATLVLRSYYVIGYVLISNKAAPLRQGSCKRKQVQLCNYALHKSALLNAGHYGLLAGGASFHGHCYGASWLLELLNI